MRRSGRDLLSLALIDSRNCTLHRFSMYQQSLQVPLMAELNPPLWELGHVGWFQEYWIGRNVERHLGPAADRTRPRLGSIEPSADRLYDSSNVSHDERWHLELPEPDSTLAYLVETLESTLDMLAHAPETDDGLYFFRLALFHEDMHAEAFAYMAQTLGLPMPELPWPIPVAQRPAVGVPATRWQLGSRPGNGFVFDNEKWAHEQRVPEFEIDAQPVTWAQYIEFIEDGGYDEALWWSAEGWAWLQASGRRAPRHVEQVRHGLLVQRGDALVRAALNTPVMHVNWHEAQAWCRWAGRRLPSEAEWEVAAGIAGSRGFRWGEVWEWTASRFEPYAGFQADPYADYSQPWFGTHRVLRGGSFATRPRMKHVKYRNFYRPERDDVFSGFRSCAL
ncbi:SUMF1/EgtB/PvdO family nonheme iron enzyme [Schlegelella sp. S2-27]|uniref:SUMF1/EgtB/PvdO family nonheme iron enzyme n=2 Tax=Caldimonas mangrovi TaxID=2944811 RepID=A0ABT0YM92_9BURK|nr:selenoneine synthase SenA [Caldimonas mangrovi]MCM5679544.1 SUMF1/EgtB/PvdO family nonheme iron enzyme [Caldimonas mangrovi]